LMRRHDCVALTRMSNLSGEGIFDCSEPENIGVMKHQFQTPDIK